MKFSFLFFSIFFSINALAQNTPIKFKVDKAENQNLWIYSLDSVNSVHHFGKIVRYEEKSYMDKLSEEIEWQLTDSTLVITSESVGNPFSLTYEKAAFPDSIYYNSMYERLDLETKLIRRTEIPKSDFLFYGKLTSTSSRDILPKFLLFTHNYQSLSRLIVTRLN